MTLNFSTENSKWASTPIIREIIQFHVNLQLNSLRSIGSYSCYGISFALQMRFKSILDLHLSYTRKIMKKIDQILNKIQSNFVRLTQ